MKVRVLIAGMLVMGTLAVPGRAALPPGYGGTLRILSPEPLRVPEPTQVISALEATLAGAVFDSLDSLLVEPPRRLPGDPLTWVFRLREGIARHDRRPLQARDVVIHLRHVDRGPARWWLAPLARERERLVAAVEDDRTWTLRSADPDFDLSLMMRVADLALRVGRGTGTGAYRPRLVRDELRLFQFRQASRGAPYIRDFRFLPTRTRAEDLRALVLGEAEASFAGASLHGRHPERPTARRGFPAVTPVLLVPNPGRRAARDGWQAVNRIVDRHRLARVGLQPSASLLPDLPESGLVSNPGSSQTVEQTILIRSGDRFTEELVGAIAALFDAAGATLRVVRVASEQWAAAIHRGRWDLRLVELSPSLPSTTAAGRAAVVASAYAAVGRSDIAAALWSQACRTGGEASSRAAALANAARELPGRVLGMRQLELFVDAQVRGSSFDELGRLRLGALHLPRERTVTP